MLTSSPSYTDTYPASENLPPLQRDWLSNAGTILTVHAGSCTLCSSLDMLVDGIGCPSASAKSLLDLCSVCMKGYPTITAWYVHSVFHANEGIIPSSTPCFTCFYVSLFCVGCSHLYLCASEVRLCWRL